MLNYADKKLLIETIAKFSEKKVAVVGDIVVDKYVYGIVERVNPENPAAPVIKILNKDYRLGCAANVALNVQSLGAKAMLSGIIGKDYNGTIIENLCKDNKLESLLLRDGKTIVKERFIESEFNQYLLRADDGETALEPINEDFKMKIYNYLANLYPDAIILSDYNKRIFIDDFGKNLVEFANSKKIPIIIDPKPANALSFARASLFRPNIKEAREITGYKKENEKEVTKKLFDIMNPKYVAVTCGKNGIVCYDGYGFTEIPIDVREVVDVTGAGDAVCSAITLGLVSGLNLSQAAYLANYAAVIENKELLSF